MGEHGKWESNTHGGDVFIITSDSSSVFVAEALGETREVRAKRAAFIVLACNSHKDSMKACEALVAFCESKDRLNDDGICPTKAYELAKAAIAKPSRPESED